MKVDIKKLQQKSPLKYLDRSTLRVLADVAETNRYSKKDQLFKAGDSERMSAFLIKGSVILESIDGRISRIDHSHSMSEFALANLKPRMYTATAASDNTVIFWVKDEVLEKMNSETRQHQGIMVTDTIYAHAI